MDFSVWPAPRRWADVLDLALLADRTGWHGIWFADHFMPSDDRAGTTIEVWSTLAALAQATSRIRLGSLVCSVTYRHPAVLAKTATNVDHISGGRAVLGVGAGWQTNEHDAYGFRLGTVAERCDRLEEAAAVIGSMLRNERTTFVGEHYAVEDAPNEPRPMQSRLPLLVAGKGERRTMPTAARFADEWNGWCTPAELALKRSVLDRLLNDAGRAPSDVRCSTQAFVSFATDPDECARFASATVGRPTLTGSPAEMVEQVAAFEAAGADELIIPDWLLTDRSERHDVFERFRTEVIDVVTP